MRLTQPHLIPNSLDYELIKSALQSERFEQIAKVGRYFLRFDPQVSAEVYKRRLLVARLPVVLESSDLKLQEAFSKIQKHGWYNFIFNMTDALFFGCCYFFRGYKNGGLDYRVIDPKFLNCDLEGDVFVYSNSQRIYLEDRDDVLKVGEMNVFNSVCYRVLSVAALKFVAMSKYMTYLENLSVPPLILKSDGFEDDKELNKLLDNLEDLRAASIGIFSKDDILELLNGNVDQG
ncbi:phage portal protein family protein, partial [Helicobacter suis]|uniref:phage portal protein family protein n=1 Tax=Helicobacter suis TaxID=104628 RepID=UPI003D322B2B